MTPHETTERTGEPSQDHPAANLPSTPNEEYYRRGAQRQGNRAPLGIALIIVGLIWLVTSFGVAPAVLSARGETIIDDTLPGSRIVLNAGSADVEVERWDGEGIRVQAIRHGGSEGDFNVSVRQEGDTVRVSHTAPAPFFFFSRRSLSYHIQVPADTAAEIQTVSGDVSAEDLAGDTTIRTTSGDVELQEVAGSLLVATVSGDIEIEDARTTDAQLSTTSGDIKVDGISQALTIETISGEVAVSDARDVLLTVSKTSGDLNFTGSLAPGGANRVTSISGDVTLRLPKDSAFRLDMSTISGELESEFELREAERDRRSLRGERGDGNTTLTVETTSGDVRIVEQ